MDDNAVPTDDTDRDGLSGPPPVVVDAAASPQVTARARPRPVDAPDSDIPERLAYNVVLPDFEGPLDLLLFLCKSHEIDIVQLPVAFITQKYLEYLDVLKQTSVDVAAEYLVMAATLCYLKSRELVPTPDPVEAQGEDDEAGMDPREELIRRLLEYQKYKDAAEQLGARPIEGRNVFGRGMPGYEGPKPEGELAEHSPWKLIEAFAGLIAKAGPQHTHDVVVDRMSVAERINQLIDHLESGGGTFRFDSVIDLALPEAELRHQLVVTLLAILELARLRAIRVLEDSASHTFFIARSARVTDEDLRNAREAPITSEHVDRDDTMAMETTAPEAVETAKDGSMSDSDNTDTFTEAPSTDAEPAGGLPERDMDDAATEEHVGPLPGEMEAGGATQPGVQALDDVSGFDDAPTAVSAEMPVPSPPQEAQDGHQEE